MAAAPSPNIAMVSAPAPAIPVISTTGSTTACASTGVLLTSSSASGNQWFKDGVAIAEATGNTYSTTQSGAYTVKVTTLCCTSAASAAVNVSIKPAPTATVTASGPVSFFAGGSVVLNANAGSGYSYLWSKDGSDISGATNSSLTVSESGAYRVTVTSSGCQAVSEPITVAKMFSLPASNFRVSLSGESCKTSNNGKIIITATEELSYTATIVVNGTSTTQSFTKTTTIGDLSAGNYSLCITVDGKAGYKQCFNNLVVKEPQDLSVYSSVDQSTNKISLSLSGGSKYNISLNGQVYSSTKSNIELTLVVGNNKISVSTDSQCQGVFERVITVNDKVILYPNPFENTLNLKLGAEAPQKAEIEVKSVDGKLMYKTQFLNSESDFHLDLSHLGKGVYILKLTLDKSESFYKVLKQ